MNSGFHDLQKTYTEPCHDSSILTDAVGGLTMPDDVAWYMLKATSWETTDL